VIIIFSNNKIEKFSNKEIEYLIKKKPISFKCFKDHEDGKELLNQTNGIMPKIKYNKFTPNRVPSLDKFKTLVLDKIEKSNIQGIFREISNPTTSIWEKPKFNKIPLNKFNNILSYHKQKLDNEFFSYIRNNKMSGIRCPELIDCRTTIIKPGIIKIFESDDWYKFYFIYSYYIKNKILAYTLFSTTYINKKTNDIKINTIKIAGIIPEQDINLNSGYSKTNLDKHINIYNNYPFTPYRTNKGYLRSDNYKNIIASEEEQQDFLDKRKKDEFSYKHRSFCIGGKGNTKETCESSITSSGDNKIPGTWDSPCLDNYDCPFYKKNKNYDNERGGCKNELCEMPLNIVQLGPKTYEKNYKPFCHNCPENNPTCCDTQTNFKSPDYAFKDDKKDRIKHENKLSEQKLKV